MTAFTVYILVVVPLSIILWWVIGLDNKVEKIDRALNREIKPIKEIDEDIFKDSDRCSEIFMYNYIYRFRNKIIFDKKKSSKKVEKAESSSGSKIATLTFHLDSLVKDIVIKVSDSKCLLTNQDNNWNTYSYKDGYKKHYNILLNGYSLNYFNKKMVDNLITILGNEYSRLPDNMYSNELYRFVFER